MEEIEVWRTGNKYLNDCETYKIGFERGKQKGYVFKMIIWLFNVLFWVFIVFLLVYNLFSVTR